MADIAKVRYSHQAMADVLLANPAITQNEVAAFFGYSPGWVSQVINSDAFQTYLDTRREELVDPVIKLSIEERLQSLVVKSLGVLHEKLATESKADVALKSLEIGTRALGYGAKDRDAVSVNFVVALPPRAPNSQAWLEGQNTVIDVSPVPQSG